MQKPVIDSHVPSDEVQQQIVLWLIDNPQITSIPEAVRELGKVSGIVVAICMIKRNESYNSPTD